MSETITAALPGAGQGRERLATNVVVAAVLTIVLLGSGTAA